ncbi:MAG: extracellular solute-binding protein, partial [Chloroflexi bacterium]|nr:extracellular solute-binding protein [Chloroflexota bacterium]
MSKRYTLLGVLSILVLVLLIAAACGEDATPRPATAVPAPTAIPGIPSGPLPTAVPAAPAPTAVPGAPAPTAVPGAPAPTAVPAAPAPTAAPSTGLRDRSEWTLDNPATLAEIEAELEKHRGEDFVFVSWGGAYQAAQRQAYIIPFQDKFGIDIIEDSPNSYAKLRVMAETGNVSWHVADVGGDFFFGFQDVPEELDFTVIDRRNFFEVLKLTPYAAGGGITWSSVIAYSTETYPDGGPQPTTMMDFFDTDKFPGRRSWPYYHNHMLRFAQLALHPELLDTIEGRASLSALTDETVEESWAFLEEHTDENSVLWQTGSDCPQFLISGEVDMCTAWNGRIFDAQQEGAPLKICWTCGHLLSTDSFIIVKGLKDDDLNKY